jgi:hypothetical protein
MFLGHACGGWMMSAVPSVADDLAACRAVIAAQLATIDEQHQQIDKLRHELELF